MAKMTKKLSGPESRRSFVAPLLLTAGLLGAAACGVAEQNVTTNDGKKLVPATAQPATPNKTTAVDMSGNPYICIVKRGTEIEAVQANEDETVRQAIEEVVTDQLSQERQTTFTPDDLLTQACVQGVINYMQDHGGVHPEQQLQNGDQIQLPEPTFEIAIK